MDLTGYIKSTEKDIDKAKKQTASLEQHIAQLGATVGALTAFVKGTAILSGLSAKLQKGWQTVNVSLQEVTDHDVPASFVTATVNSIMADWDQVVAVAKNL
jgi:septal ring factor EnvC (AmiA/AmiB activator)